MITAAWILGSLLCIAATWFLALRVQEAVQRRQQRHFLTEVLGPNLKSYMATPQVEVVTVAVEPNPSRRRARPAGASPLALLPYHAAGTML